MNSAERARFQDGTYDDIHGLSREDNTYDSSIHTSLDAVS